MRSRKLLPGSWVISTTMRSESTRVPPVTALRSPPDSRITGADSPVIADSSTEAMPSITVPSPGISSPASTTTTSPRCSSEAGFSPPSRRRATVSVRIARRASAWALPRPSASASARFANTTVSHSQTRHGEGEPGGLVAAAERLAAEDLDQPADRRDQRADLHHEHDRVADLDARVELAEARRPAPGRRVGAPSRLCARSVIASASRRRAPGSARARSRPARRARRAPRPSVFSSTSSCTRVERRAPRTSATRRAWIRALAWEMCGSTPEAEVVTASTGTSRCRRPGVVRAARARGRRRGSPRTGRAAPCCWARGC